MRSSYSTQQRAVEQLVDIERGGWAMTLEKDAIEAGALGLCNNCERVILSVVKVVLKECFAQWARKTAVKNETRWVHGSPSQYVPEFERQEEFIHKDLTFFLPFYCPHSLFDSVIHCI